MGDQVFDVWAVLAHGMVADTSDGPSSGLSRHARRSLYGWNDILRQ
jgi:hypothetical protein